MQVVLGKLVWVTSILVFFVPQTGRKLVFRSEPPRHKKREDDGADQASREEEELAYFFQYWVQISCGHLD